MAWIKFGGIIVEVGMEVKWHTEPGSNLTAMGKRGNTPLERED